MGFLGGRRLGVERRILPFARRSPFADGATNHIRVRQSPSQEPIPLVAKRRSRPVPSTAPGPGLLASRPLRQESPT